MVAYLTLVFVLGTATSFAGSNVVDEEDAVVSAAVPLSELFPLVA